jgi:hypothetical protein
MRHDVSFFAEKLMFKGFVFGDRKFLGLYCINPGTRLPKIYRVERKGSTNGFIVVGRTSRAMPQSLHSRYAN